MDIGSFIGLFGAFALLFASILMNNNPLSMILHLPSFVLVLGGSYLALMLSSSLSESLSIWKIFGRTFKLQAYNEASIIQKLVAFSEKARREGLLALEDELEDLDDEFMKKGLRLVVDGTDAVVIRDLMELELTQMQGRHTARIGIVSQWAALAPGLGMMGTLLGLIGMLLDLSNKDAIGPSMSLALITTLYGSMISNLAMIPFAAKLKKHDNAESNVREMIIEGVLSIQAGENTRILALKLLAYLAPDVRTAVESEYIKD